MIEILAPAGDENAFNAAINNGADAIYLGMGNFNARQKAPNFTKEVLIKCVKKAHLFNVKVYLTVNTLINNNEILPLINTIKDAIESKIDAFIVQDLGVCYLLKKYFKGIVLHASTQMGVHNLAGARVLEKLGFKRVVLSRETSLEDIKQIKNNTNLEIEYFVQGALCVGFSGNCYLSSVLNCKSGNRGECLQLCRLRYSAFDNNKFLKDGYLLSPTDLCLLSKIKELVSSGVTSFKIEGRLKRESYVALTVSVYKKAINHLENQNFFEDENKLKKIFNRGEFNKGYYLNNEKLDFINDKFPNHRGEKIGNVIKVQKFKNINEIIIKSGVNITSGCGLKFVTENEELSAGVGNVEKLNNNLYKIFSNCKPKLNSEVYLTLDKNFENCLIKENKKLPINISFISNINEKAKLTLSYNNIEVSVTSTNIIEKAKNSSASKDNVISSLNKLNDTIFKAINFNVNIENVFLPVSVLNSLRRQAVKILEEKILNSYSIINVEYDKNIDTLVQNELISINQNKLNENFTIVDENTALNNLNTNIIFAPSYYNKIVFDNFFKRLYNSNFSKKLYLSIPAILKNKEIDLINELLNMYNFKGIYINNLSGLFFKNNKEVIVSYMLNVTNSFALKNLLNLNVLYVCNSIEYFATKISNIGYKGNATLMNYCHCPYQVCFKEQCNKCKFNNNLIYKLNKNEFKIRRLKLINCYFEMLYPVDKREEYNIIDLR